MAAEPNPTAPQVVRLPEVMDLKAAAPLRDGLLAVRGGPVHLDASRVQRIGGLCLQVLLSARHTWTHDAASFRVIDPSPEFRDGLALFGAASLTDEPGARL